MDSGLVDTNVFLHAQTRDPHAEECRDFLQGLRDGQGVAQLEPLVLHELSYALPHYRKGMSRAEVGEFLLAILGWPGILGNKNVMIDAVTRWQDTPGLAFVDAYLAALARERPCSIFTKNVRELRAQGVEVPDPLPGAPPKSID